MNRFVLLRFAQNVSTTFIFFQLFRHIYCDSLQPILVYVERQSISPNFSRAEQRSNSTQHSLFSFTFKCKCMANKILGQFSYGFRAQCKRMCHGMYVYACVCPFQRQPSGSTMAWDYMKSNRRLRNNLSKAIKKRSETKLCIGWNGPNKQNSVASSRYGCCLRRCPCCVHIFVMYSVVMASHGFAVAGQCPFHSLTHAHTMKERV